MKIPINPERIEGESFEAYKKRQKLVNKTIKQYRKGQLIWISQKGEVYIPDYKKFDMKDKKDYERVIKERKKENWGTFKRKKDEKSRA